MSKELIALGLTLAVHVVAAVVVVWALLDEDRIDWRSFLWPRDSEDDGGGGGRRPGGTSPQTGPNGPSGLPLPDAQQAPQRLRQPVRLGDLYPRPQRRPAHVPAPEPAPERATP